MILKNLRGSPYDQTGAYQTKQGLTKALGSDFALNYQAIGAFKSGADFFLFQNIMGYIQNLVFNN